MAKRTISIGFSPCPNDTFIFDALVNGRMDNGDIAFKVYLEDVETLNRWAMEGRLDITKISYHALCFCNDRYQLLQSGSALGRGCGPLLIAKKMLTEREVIEGVIAIPGKYTTANLLFSLAYPQANNTREVMFSAIEDQVLSGEVTAGVIIHENRFTYESKGLCKILDLGEFWEMDTGYPIPLGGIVIKRDWPEEDKLLINRLIAESVAHAFAHPDDSRDYVRCHAQEMDEEVTRQHIDLYVNEYSLALGLPGQQAVRHLFEKAAESGIISRWKDPIWIG